MALKGTTKGIPHSNFTSHYTCSFLVNRHVVTCHIFYFFFSVLPLIIDLFIPHQGPGHQDRADHRRPGRHLPRLRNPRRPLQVSWSLDPSEDQRLRANMQSKHSQYVLYMFRYHFLLSHQTFLETDVWFVRIQMCITSIINWNNFIKSNSYQNVINCKIA